MQNKGIKFEIMRSNTPEFSRRNELVRACVEKLFKKYPQWRTEAIIKEASKRFFISSRTVEAILKGEGIYAY